MFGIGFKKAPPTTHVMQFRDGQVVRQGAGASFFYFRPTSTIVEIPLASTDVPFVFEEVTADFQDVTIQGELEYRVTDPDKLSKLLNFSVDHAGRYLSDDPTKLNDRLIQAAKTSARGFTQKHPLPELLTNNDELIIHVLHSIREADVVKMLGIEILGLTLQSIKATPEMAKALQSSAREKLLQQADEAIFARRNTAIELERQIKENELNTEVAVESKRRQVRTTKLDADIALEQQRTQFVDTQVENQRKENLARSEAMRAVLDPIKDVDWRLLMAVNSSAFDSKQMIAMAFRDLADNAQKVGTLNISPDLLQTLLSDSSK